MGRDAKRFTNAEWAELLRRSREMSAAAPADIGVQGVKDMDVVEEASDAGSEAGDGSGGGTALSARPAEPSAAPLQSPAVESGSERGLAGFQSLPSLLQLRMVLLRAVPAVALLFGSLFYAFPRAAKLAKKAGSVMYTAGSSALTVVEKLAELPDWV